MGFRRICAVGWPSASAARLHTAQPQPGIGGFALVGRGTHTAVWIVGNGIAELFLGRLGKDADRIADLAVRIVIKADLVGSGDFQHEGIVAVGVRIPFHFVGNVGSGALG